MLADGQIFPRWVNMFWIYCKKGCIYCAKARRLLSRLGYEYKLRYPSKDELEEMCGRNTYPQVYDNKKHIGGADDLERYLGVARQRGVTWKLVCHGGCH